MLLSRGQLLPAASCSASGDDFDLICREIGWTLPYLAQGHNAVAPSEQLELLRPFLWNQTLDDNFDNVMLTSQKPCQHKKNVLKRKLCYSAILLKKPILLIKLFR